MNKKIRSGWEFPPFRLDKVNATLWRNDQLVPLRHKNFTTLCYLIERHGRLVTKDELLDAVWQNRCVGEAVLRVCINELREALCDDAHAPIYLTTIPRRGYRFDARVTRIQAETSEDSGTLVHRRDELIKSERWIGRNEAQANLLHIWQKTLESVRQIVFLTGDPGIGKTILIE